MKKNGRIASVISALIASTFLSGFTSADSSGSDIHEEIIKEALDGTICPANIEVIVNGSKFQDKQTEDNSADQQRHFETKTINRSYEYAKREQKKVLNYASDADSNSDSRTRALYHFGMMLHTMQDFYSNTNYLALKIEELDRTTSGDYDPYSIDLFDWQKLTQNKTPAVGGQELKVEIARGARMLLPLRDSTYGKVERGLAIRETMRQWTFLEALLKNKYGDRSKTILIALKEASCTKKVPSEAEDSPDSKD